MNFAPTPGLAFIVEDKKETASKMGILLVHQNDNVGLIGKIIALNPVVHCPHCTEKYTRDDLKVGDHVIYSKYVSEHVELKEDEKRLGGRIFSVPLDSILAIIHDAEA